MKTPTDATKVFAPVAWTGNGTSDREISFGTNLDTFISPNRSSGSYTQRFLVSKLTSSNRLNITSTEGEGSQNDFLFPSNPFTQTGIKLGSSSGSGYNTSGLNMITYGFRRAPGFFDVVCYTGNDGNPQTVGHGLSAVPEMVIGKQRSGTSSWYVYHSGIGNTKTLMLNTTSGAIGPDNGYWGNITPTATYFYAGNAQTVGGTTHVAYLFATCPGVSKVFSFTGNGSSQTIDCGFAAGARFVLIKRTDSTGDWWVYDSARGIVSANDPALRLNSTAAEVTSADAVDPASSGFIVNQESTCNINVNSATYIGLAIA